MCRGEPRPEGEGLASPSNAGRPALRRSAMRPDVTGAGKMAELDLLGSILSAMEPPPGLGDREARRAKGL